MGTASGQKVEWLLVAGGNTTQVEVVYLGSDYDLSCVLAESAPQLMLMSVGLLTLIEEDGAEDELGRKLI